MKNIFKEFKDKICTTCVHCGENTFQKCEIRECVNSDTQKCKTIAKCLSFERSRK
jgi:hypothetical protein